MSVGKAGKLKILVVDDIEINRIILEEILSDVYEIEQAADGMEAISKLYNAIEKPHLVLLDIMMPGMDGFEVLDLMKADPTLKKIPVIFITAADEEMKGLAAGATDYISKPFEPEIVRLRVSNIVELFLYREQLENMVEQKTAELVTTKETFLETMAGMIEYRSLESGQHIKRSMSLTGILVKQLLKTNTYSQELLNKDYHALIKAAALHDVGKIVIPDDILLKPGKLTPEEFKIIETHTVIGSEIVKSMMLHSNDSYLEYCYEISRSHHERWDGNGYPDRLSGEAIPLSARIVAVVDVYDALTNERCYKKAFPHETAIEILQQDSGKHFDPLVIVALMEVQELLKHEH